MAVFNSLYDLRPEKSSFILWQVASGFGLELVKQTAAVDKFHDKENLLSWFKNLVKFCNVWMVKFI